MGQDHTNGTGPLPCNQTITMQQDHYYVTGPLLCNKTFTMLQDHMVQDHFCGTGPYGIEPQVTYLSLSPAAAEKVVGR